jgi:hypothetical protein
MKHRFFKYLLFSLFLLVGFSVSAQNVEHGPDALSIITAFIQKWGVFILAIWEVVIRYLPTAKSMSFLTFFIRIIQFLVPDVKSTGNNLNAFGSHDTAMIQKVVTTLEKGDKMKTKTGKVVKFERFVNSETVLTTDKDVVKLNTVIEVAQKSYALMDAIRDFIASIKAKLIKRQTATN